VNGILLDTHALIWWANGSRSLSARARRLLEHDATTVIVSAATAWEIATKVRLGRVVWAANQSVEGYCAAQRFALLPVSFAHAERAGSWTASHGDPFDRMLAAQSHIERLPLLTNDTALGVFGIETVW
jgi:PIN domain nuclease of toxin-antitoxin system